MTDKDRLDFLQTLTDMRRSTGRVICRWSYFGRGWRLHETEHEDGVSDVRKAIDNMMQDEKGA